MIYFLKNENRYVVDTEKWIAACQVLTVIIIIML